MRLTSRVNRSMTFCFHAIRLPHMTSGYGLSDGSTRDHLETLSITPTFLIPPHYLSRPMVDMSCYCSPLRRSPRRGRRLSLRQVGDITNFRLTILDWYQTSCCDSSSTVS